MAVLFITEYAFQGQNPDGRSLPEIPLEPPLAEQTVAIGGASAQSAAFNAGTTFVRIHTDVICSIAFGTNPTATATTRRLAAGSTEYFAVPRGQSFKVANITNV